MTAAPPSAPPIQPGGLLTDGRRLVEVAAIEESGDLMVLDVKKHPPDAPMDKTFKLFRREWAGHDPQWLTPSDWKVKHGDAPAAA